MSDDERPAEDEAPANEESNSEDLKVRMEQEKKKRQEKANEEWAEYEEIRKVQREKEQEDIKELRERREKRKKEREEEEKRLAELRAQEEQKRRAEEDERQKRKREEENNKKEARDKKRMEAEARSKNIGKPNFTIGKRADTDANQDGEPQEPKKEQKSKEQLEAERKAALEQRYHQLNTAGFSVEQFRQKAKDLHQVIYKLESDKYDLKKRFEQQNYDMMELSEKARQMNKGGAKNAKVNVNQSPDPLASKMSGVPPKITMYSQYERVKDHRPFVERRDVFSGPLYSDEYQRIEPEHKVIMTEMGAKITDGEAGGDSHGHSKENEAPVENHVNGE